MNTSFTHTLHAHLQTFRSLIAVSILVLITLVMAATAQAGGPDRRTFTSASPADYVTFNSITDNPEHGDERNFVLIREAGVGTYKNDIKLQAGKEYEVYTYFHNNAKTSLNPSGQGIATGARVSAQLPSVVKAGERGIVGGAITADNANPKRVWDEAYVTTDSTMSLRYVPASARIHSGGAVNNAVLPDTLFSANGTFLGYFSLNGVLPGCADYAGYVIYKVKADKPSFEVTKDVSLGGANQYADTVSAKAGSKVDFKIAYKNVGTTDQNNVTIKDTLPAGLTYVNGSTLLRNNANPNGLKVSDNVTKGGINIGNYGPNAYGTVTFSATINPETCGMLKNTAAAITSNGTKSDTATVTSINDNCTVPSALPTTGPAEVAAAMIGLLAITIGLVYYVKSRQELHAVIKMHTHK